MAKVARRCILTSLPAHGATMLPLLLLSLTTASNSLAADDTAGSDPSADQQDQMGSHTIWGQLQMWTTLADQDATAVADAGGYGDPEADPGFSIPRGRVGVYGSYGDKWSTSYAIGVGIGTAYDALGTDDGDVQIVDAVGGVHAAWSAGRTDLTLGQQMVPFGRGQLIPSRTLVFQERDLISNYIAPGRGVGALAAQTLRLSDSGRVVVQAGAFNGNGSFLGDEDAGITVAARGELAMGAAYRTWSPDLKPALGVGASFLTDNAAATAQTAIGADFLGRFKWLTLTGEFATATLKPTDTTIVAPIVADGTTQVGLATQLSFYLPLGDSLVDGGGPSGLEIAGRLSTFDDATAFDDYGDVAIIHTGLTYRELLPRFDVGGGYILRNETKSDPLPNNTVRLWVQFRPSVTVMGPPRSEHLLPKG